MKISVKGFLLLSCMWMLQISCVFAQSSSAFPVEVISSAHDMTGQRLVYQIKEGIRKSSSMRITAESEARIQLRIATMPKRDDDPTVATIYSALWTLQAPDQGFPYFWTRTLGYCGSDRVASSAESLVAETDKAIDELQRLIKKQSAASVN